MAVSAQREAQKPEGGEVSEMWESGDSDYKLLFQEFDYKEKVRDVFFKMGKNSVDLYARVERGRLMIHQHLCPNKQQLPSTPLKPSQLSTPIFSTSCPKYKRFVVCCLSSPSLPFRLSQRDAGPYSCSRRSQYL